jgi:hypothetical protein
MNSFTGGPACAAAAKEHNMVKIKALIARINPPPGENRQDNGSHPVAQQAFISPNNCYSGSQLQS